MADSGGSPALGPRDLGVRVGYDISADGDGNVHPLCGGMSIAPDSPRNLPRFCLPPSLGGTGKKPVWAIGEDSFSEALRIRLDPKRPAEHAFVEPTRITAVDAYVSGLEASATAWKNCDA